MLLHVWDTLLCAYIACVGSETPDCDLLLTHCIRFSFQLSLANTMAYGQRSQDDDFKSSHASQLFNRCMQHLCWHCFASRAWKKCNAAKITLQVEARHWSDTLDTLDSVNILQYVALRCKVQKAYEPDAYNGHSSPLRKVLPFFACRWANGTIRN